MYPILPYVSLLKFIWIYLTRDVQDFVERDEIEVEQDGWINRGGKNQVFNPEDSSNVRSFRTIFALD